MIVEALFEINYQIMDDDDSGDPVTHLSEKEIAYIETTVHREYLKTQLNLGLDVRNYLEDKIDAQKRDYARKLNDITIRALPKLCKNVGLKIVKTD